MAKNLLLLRGFTHKEKWQKKDVVNCTNVLTAAASLLEANALIRKI